MALLISQRMSGALARSLLLSFPTSAQVPLNEYEFPTAKLANVQSELQRLIEKNYYLNQSAKDAYRAYVLAYNSHSLKDIFNVHTLDLSAVAVSFGFTKPPRVRTCASAADTRCMYSRRTCMGTVRLMRTRLESSAQYVRCLWQVGHQHCNACR